MEFVVWTVLFQVRSTRLEPYFSWSREPLNKTERKKNINNLQWKRQYLTSTPQFSLITQLYPTLCGPHGLQHARLPCPSPTPRACSTLRNCKFSMAKDTICNVKGQLMGFPCGSAGKQSACNGGDLGSIPGLGRCPGEEKGYPLQYSGLENPMDCIVHGQRRVRHDWAIFTSLQRTVDRLRKMT